MTHNISYEEQALSTSNVSGDFAKISELKKDKPTKYGDVFFEVKESANKLIFGESTTETSCGDLACYVKCSCAGNWTDKKPSGSNYLTLKARRPNGEGRHGYAISGDEFPCYLPVTCEHFGYLSSCPTGKTCTEVTPHGTLKCYEDPTCYFTESTSTTCPEDYSISTTSCSSGYTLKQADGTTTTTYTSEASDCKKDSVTTTATNACGLCEQEGCPSDYFEDEPDSNYFKYTSQTVGSKTCYKAECKTENPYITTSETEAGSYYGDRYYTSYHGTKCYFKWPTGIHFVVKGGKSTPYFTQGSSHYSVDDSLNKWGIWLSAFINADGGWLDSTGVTVKEKRPDSSGGTGSYTGGTLLNSSDCDEGMLCECDYEADDYPTAAQISEMEYDTWDGDEWVYSLSQSSLSSYLSITGILERDASDRYPSGANKSLEITVEYK